MQARAALQQALQDWPWNAPLSKLMPFFSWRTFLVQSTFSPLAAVCDNGNGRRNGPAMRPRFACIMVSSGLQGVPHGWKLRFVGILPSLGGEVLGNREFGDRRADEWSSAQLFTPCTPPSLPPSFAPSLPVEHAPTARPGGWAAVFADRTYFVKNTTQMARAEREGKITLTSGRLRCLNFRRTPPLPPFTSLVSPSLASSPSLAPNQYSSRPLPSAFP